jgi:mannose-6-phosphate isomerase-like protein (cupin superfamily)
MSSSLTTSPASSCGKNKETRPWGEFHILFDGDCKIKRLVVLPQKRLSLQSHRHRQEFWVVLQGHGKAQLDGDFISLSPNVCLTILKDQKHRLINDHETETLELIEIQTGTYFGEDDIIRYEDDFARI